MRILVVEDEKEIADGISRILGKAGYQVDCVFDGMAGLDYCFCDIYDLILLDVMLPKINGFEIVKTVREKGIKTPIILLTAKSQLEDKITGLNIGADDYITKPFDGGELLARIGARLRSQKEIRNGKLSVFDICLDPATYRLEKEMNSVKLTKKEYQLLEFFMMNKKQILSKDMIIQKVWGNDDETEYNNIEVYVSFLRKKLRFVNAGATIVTTKGIGYSFTDGED